MNSWRCLECGRMRRRDQVFIHDAGPICRDRAECRAAEFGDDDYPPEPVERAPAEHERND